jgi:hypothetical protein
MWNKQGVAARTKIELFRKTVVPKLVPFWPNTE